VKSAYFNVYYYFRFKRTEQLWTE